MGKFRVHCCYFPLRKLLRNFRRFSLSKRTLIVATLCLANLLFLVLKVGHLEQPRSRRTNEERKRHTRSEHHSFGELPATSDLQTQASLEVPTLFNVVYVTLKFKSLKPANVRGTIRPKLRKKVRRKTIYPTITQRKLEKGQVNRSRTWRSTGTSRKAGRLEEFSLKSYNDGTDPRFSSIRIYSEMAPQWFSAMDVKSMRFLADAKVLRIKEIPRLNAPSLVIFEGADMDPQTLSQKHLNRNNICGGQCGIIHCSVGNTEVFAFHLDRVLGLNRTIPAVSRKFGFLNDGQACQVVLWDVSLHPKDLAAGPATVRMTWREYQTSLTQRCWQINVNPKANSGCSSIYHSEWSKLALFDFLLQIHNRLDPSCCGFTPRQEDVCVQLGHHDMCKDQENIQLANIVHREHDLRHLVFTNNKGIFDHDEENLDFRLLEGIKELPEQAVSVLRNRKLREKLLQSLFLDQMYWESQGGRQGIDKLIDVIEKRANILLTYINAHGIGVIPMND
ncbi:Golgi-associated kinase 1B-like [Poeciliopsis prolifica]|uniref:Golgi-associated kinase 1B-like n=1 Tax=Poeciliopsis prolifica TaxID=188132 RepID=UPI002413734B|nr:Golgi-associated kinase 1B-like [Poeciliopsis prolifica]XP_054886835.1 Golgi-associated kinase 1B-like [Poeciliopsis prolifica]